MKIRSNENSKWSIEGLVLEPGKVIELPKNLEEKFDKFIKLGLISVVDYDGADKVSTVVKVDKAPEKKPVVTKRVNLLNPTQSIYVEPQQDLNVVVESGTEDQLNVPLVPKEADENPKVEVTEVDQEPIVVERHGDPRTDGFVVVPGKKPGEGQAITVEDYLDKQANSVKEVLENTAKELEALKVEEPKPITDVSQRTQEVLNKDANSRKLFVAQLNDKDFLLEIAQSTHDKNIQSIINQRLEELK